MAMSGVTLADGVMAAMSDLRMKKSRYVLMAIGNEGKNIIVKEIGAREATYAECVGKFGADEPCYVGFDFQYKVDGVDRDKLILIQWIPDTAKPRNKMLYSSSRDALNSVSEGFLAVQANDPSELDAEEIIRRIKTHRTA